MMNLSAADNSTRKLLYAFRNFYSASLKFNISVNADEDEWDIPDNIRDTDILGLLRKNINDLKTKYNLSGCNKIKLENVEKTFLDLYKLKFDDIGSFVSAFALANTTCRRLVDSNEFILLKWFITTFYEMYLQVAAKALDIYNLGVDKTIIGVKLGDGNTLSLLTSSLIDKDNLRNPKILSANLFNLYKYIKDSSESSNIISVSFRNTMGLYIKCSDSNKDIDTFKTNSIVEEFTKLFDNLVANEENANNIIQDLLKVNEDTSSKASPIPNDAIMLGDGKNKFNTSNISMHDKSKLYSIVFQTANNIVDNEDGNVNFNIDSDFKSYFLNNKEDFKVFYIGNYGHGYTVAEYNGIKYLLYMKKDDKNVYGVSLSLSFNEPSNIIKVEPDDEGKFEFIVDTIDVNYK